MNLADMIIELAEKGYTVNFSYRGTIRGFEVRLSKIINDVPHISARWITKEDISRANITKEESLAFALQFLEREFEAEFGRG